MALRTFHLPLLAACVVLVGHSQPTTASIDIRVGVVAYEDFHNELEHFEELFAELSRQEPSLRFRLAVGSYGDVTHWLDEQQVDLAILTPGLFAALLSPDPAQPVRCAVPISGHTATAGRPLVMGVGRAAARGFLRGISLRMSRVGSLRDQVGG